MSNTKRKLRFKRLIHKKKKKIANTFSEVKKCYKNLVLLLTFIC